MCPVRSIASSSAICRKWTEFPGVRQCKAFQTARSKSVSLSCCRTRENQLMYRCQLSPWRTPSLDMTHARRDMTLPRGAARPPTVIGASGSCNPFNAGTIWLLRLAAPLLLLGCSAASDTRAGASPRIRSDAAVSRSEPEPTQTLIQQPPPDMRTAPSQPVAPSEATAARNGTGY